MKKTYEAKISEITRLVEDLEAFCSDRGIGAETIFAFSLCLDEIFTNIVEYGYRGEGGQIEVGLATEGCEMSATVADWAPPFNPLEDAADPDLDADLEDRQVGGLGIYLVKKQMDKVSYARANGRNELKLTKSLPC